MEGRKEGALFINEMQYFWVELKPEERRGQKRKERKYCAKLGYKARAGKVDSFEFFCDWSERQRTGEAAQNF